MKRFNILSSFILCFSMLTISCTKQNCSKDEKQTVNVNLKMNDPYQYELGLFGDEEGVIISRQAAHFSSSMVERDISKTKMIYKYQPTPGYIGADEVELVSQRGSDGAGRNKKKQVTLIKFSITN